MKKFILLLNLFLVFAGTLVAQTIEPVTVDVTDKYVELTHNGVKTYFYNLYDANKAAVAGDTLLLLKNQSADKDSNKVVTFTEGVVLNLNDSTLTINGLYNTNYDPYPGIQFMNLSDTVRVINGKIVNGNDLSYAFMANNGGRVLLGENLIINTTNGSFSVNSHGQAPRYGEVIVDGAVITSTTLVASGNGNARITMVSGKMESTGSLNVVAVTPGTTLTINGGVIASTAELNTNVQTFSYNHAVCSGGGKIVVNGGEVSSSNGIAISAQYEGNEDKLVVSGGTISAKIHAVYTYGGPKVTIKGGTIKSSDSCGVYTEHGGTITIKNDTMHINDKDTIIRPRIKGEVALGERYVSDYVITGGTYSDDVVNDNQKYDPSYVDTEVYTTKKNFDEQAAQILGVNETWTIVPVEKYVELTHNGVKTKFKNLTEANAAAVAGDTLTLLKHQHADKDYEGQKVNFDKAVVLNLNDSTLTVDVAEGLTILPMLNAPAADTVKIINGNIVNANGALDIISVDGGKVLLGEKLVVNTDSSYLWVVNGGEAIIDGAELISTSTEFAGAAAYQNNSTITMVSGTMASTGYNAVGAEGNATLNIIGGKIYTTADILQDGRGYPAAYARGAGATVNVGDVDFEYEAEAEIYSEHSQALAAMNGATVNIAGGKIYSKGPKATVKTIGGSKVNISGGMIVDSAAVDVAFAAVEAGGADNTGNDTIFINGGPIVVSMNGNAVLQSEQGVVFITGDEEVIPTISAKNFDKNAVSSTDNNVFISGGQYSDDVKNDRNRYPSTFVQEGYGTLVWEDVNYSNNDNNYMWRVLPQDTVLIYGKAYEFCYSGDMIRVPAPNQTEDYGFTAIHKESGDDVTEYVIVTPALEIKALDKGTYVRTLYDTMFSVKLPDALSYVDRPYYFEIVSSDTLTIKPRTLKYVWKDGFETTKAYDGTPFTATFENIEPNNPQEGCYGLTQYDSITAGTFITNDYIAGTYTCTQGSFQADELQLNFKDFAIVNKENGDSRIANYKPDFSNLEVGITQKEIEFTASDTKEYDGLPFGPETNDGYTITEGTLAAGDSAVVTISETAAACPGTYPNIINSVVIMKTDDAENPDRNVTESYVIREVTGTLTINGLECSEPVEYEGHTYNVVKIGAQCWMAENLRVNTGKDTIYKNEPNNEETFGRLYTWYTAMASTSETALEGVVTMRDDCLGEYVQGICPQGWAIPTNADFEVLSQNVAGMQAIKSDNSDYWIPSEIGDNTTGFDARGAGLLNAATGRFENLLSGTYYWTCDGVFNVGAFPAGIGSSMAVTYYCDNFIPTPSSAKDMKSIRCIRKAAYEEEEDECIMTDGNVFWIDFVDDYYTAEIWFDYSAGQLTADAVSATINDEPVSPDFISIQYEENTSFAVISIPVDQVDDQFTMVVTIAAPGCNPKVLRGSYGVDECFGFDGAPTVTQNNNNDGLPVSLDLSITIKNMELGDVRTDGGLEFYIDNGLEYDDVYYFWDAAVATLQDNVMTGTFNITADNYDKLVGKNLNIKARLDYNNWDAVLCEGNDLGDPGVLLSEPAIHNFNGDCPAFVGTPKFEEVTENNEIVAINFSVKVKNVPDGAVPSFRINDNDHAYILGEIAAVVNNNVMTATLNANSQGLYNVTFSDLLSDGFFFNGQMQLPDEVTEECFDNNLGEGNILSSEEANYWVPCPVVPDAFTITKNANGDYVGSFTFEGNVDRVDGSWEVEGDNGNYGDMVPDYYVIENNTITITLPGSVVGDIPAGKKLTVYAIPTLGDACENEAEGTYTEPTSTTSDCPYIDEDSYGLSFNLSMVTFQCDIKNFDLEFISVENSGVKIIKNNQVLGTYTVGGTSSNTSAPVVSIDNQGQMTFDFEWLNDYQCDITIVPFISTYCKDGENVDQATDLEGASYIISVCD